MILLANDNIKKKMNNAKWNQESDVEIYVWWIEALRIWDTLDTGKEFALMSLIQKATGNFDDWKDTSQKIGYMIIYF